MKTKPRIYLWTPSATLRGSFGLLIVFVASACAPAASTQPPATEAPTQTSIPLATETAALPADTSTPDSVAIPTVQFIPTSRGPDLEATDPATVSLASGGLQLVEFFRFT
jgi:hypothetical protein